MGCSVTKQKLWLSSPLLSRASMPSLRLLQTSQLGLGLPPSAVGRGGQGGGHVRGGPLAGQHLLAQRRPGAALPGTQVHGLQVRRGEGGGCWGQEPRRRRYASAAAAPAGKGGSSSTTSREGRQQQRHKQGRASAAAAQAGKGVSSSGTSRAGRQQQQKQAHDGGRGSWAGSKRWASSLTARRIRRLPPLPAATFLHTTCLDKRCSRRTLAKVGTTLSPSYSPRRFPHGRCFPHAHTRAPPQPPPQSWHRLAPSCSCVMQKPTPSTRRCLRTNRGS